MARSLTDISLCWSEGIARDGLTINMRLLWEPVDILQDHEPDRNARAS